MTDRLEPPRHRGGAHNTAAAKPRAQAPSAALVDWLRTHPSAWTGWPTHTQLDDRDVDRLTLRLLRAGCPLPHTGRGMTEDLRHASEAIAYLRYERQARYLRQVERG